MAEGHDFKRFPELTNSQLELYYFESPHKQILESFTARVVKVHDGDTITVRWIERDFDFPVRFLDTNAPELSEDGGFESRDWLEDRIKDKDVLIEINRNQRVGKFGRILGNVIWGGMSMNQQSIAEGFSTTFEGKKEGKIPRIDEIIK